MNLKVKNQFAGMRSGLIWNPLITVLALLFLFVLPWHVGGIQPVKGESYVFGFNNKVGILGFGVCLAGLTVLRAWFFKPPSIRPLGWLSDKPYLIPFFREAKVEYMILAACSAAMVIGNLWWNKVLVIPYWGGELSYFLGRIDLVALGYKPYQDFQYNYGPALLYAPLWLSRATFGHLGIEDAYAWCVAISFVLGFCCIFVFLRAIQIPDRLRSLILLLCLVMWMCITMGLNYSPLRFTILPAALVLFDRSQSIKWGSLNEWVVAGISCFLCVGACFLVSPEMGIAASAGLLAHASIAVFSNKISRALATVVALIVCFGAMSLCFGGYLYGVRSFSSGANNFPIFANVTNLVLFFSALIVIPGLLSSSWTGRCDRRASLAAAIAGSALMLLPASFGRCDPGHVIINGLMILLMMFAVTSTADKRLLYAWMAIFALVVVCMGQISYWNGYRALFDQAFQIQSAYAANPQLLQQWKEEWRFQQSWSPMNGRLNWRKTVPFPSGLEDFVRGKKVGIPFGADVGIERLLKLQIEFGIIYHESPIPEWYAPKDVERAVRECLSFDLLLIPESIVQQSSGNIDIPSYKKQISEWLSDLLLYPVRCDLKKPPYIPELDLARALLAACDPAGKLPGYVLMKPKKLSK